MLISSTKYACETCIKGHRSSTCKHTDRPLFEIKRKGRPVTQCDHCRELRKTKQVHVKCLCELKEDPTKAVTPTSKKRSSCKVPEIAAFPNGLPEALEASVTLQLHAEGLSSDSDHASGCACKSGGNCNCCTRRKSAPKSHRRVKSDLHHDSDDNVDDTINLTSPPVTSPLPSHILARIAELRPVLPKPAVTGPLHDPSSGVAHQAGRHHTHDNMFFSPYGRAYEYTHGSEHECDPEERGQEPRHCIAQSSSLNGDPLLNEDLQPQTLNWMPPVGSTSFPSLCGCGDSCACPGCLQHNSSIAPSLPAGASFNSCSNPSTCTYCLDCTILSLSDSLPTDTALSIFDNQNQDIDEWARQVSEMPTSDATLRDGQQFAVPTWPMYQVDGGIDAEQIPQFASCEWCGGPSPPGLCKCRETSTDCACPTVAISEECVTDNQHPSNDNVDGNGTDALFRSLNLSGNGFLVAPQMPRSRSSSGSSHSSFRMPFSLQTTGTTILPSSSNNFFPRPFPLTPCESPTRMSPTEGVAYASSNPDSEGSYEENNPMYDPSLDGVQLY